MIPMRFHTVTPSLFTLDLEATVEFYTRHLGFTVDTLWPEEAPTVGILDHGPVHLLFYAERFDPEDEPAMSGQLRFDVEGVQALYDRLAPEVEVIWGPEVYHYGRREFCVRDPNGYELIFGEPTHDPPTCPDDGLTPPT